MKWNRSSESDEQGHCSRQRGPLLPEAIRTQIQRTVRSVAYQRNGMSRRLPCPFSVIRCYALQNRSVLQLERYKETNINSMKSTSRQLSQRQATMVSQPLTHAPILQLTPASRQGGQSRPTAYVNNRLMTTARSLTNHSSSPTISLRLIGCCCVAPADCSSSTCARG